MHCLQMGKNINKTDWIRLDLVRRGKLSWEWENSEYDGNSGDCFFKMFCVGLMGLNNSGTKIHIWNFCWTPTYGFKNYFFSLVFDIAHNSQINDYWNSNIFKSSINVALERQSE